jgi:hypothetical protein
VRRDEQRAREELSALARDEGGRRLLQLALRGIQESGRGLTVGCWVERGGGVSGCLFQHAYWQGLQEGVFERLQEGVFAPAEISKGELRRFVGDEDFALVMGAIRSLDALGKRRFLRWRRSRPLGLPRRVLDEAAWRSAVERILVDVLADGVREPRPAEPCPGLAARG